MHCSVLNLAHGRQVLPAGRNRSIIDQLLVDLELERISNGPRVGASAETIHNRFRSGFPAQCKADALPAAKY